MNVEVLPIIEQPAHRGDPSLYAKNQQLETRALLQGSSQSIGRTALGRQRQDYSIPVEELWKLEGACRGIDPDIFFPEDEADAGSARAVCSVCPVRVACLEYALAKREKHGVWGGASEAERRRIIRQRLRARRT